MLFAAPPAIVAQHVETAPVVAEQPAAEIRLHPRDALGMACSTFRRARAEGAGDREAMAAAFEAAARADLSPLTVAGHAKGAARVNRKAMRRAQRVLLALAEAEPSRRWCF